MSLAGIATSLSPPTQVLFKLDKPAYSTPPPVSNDPANNECKMVEYRGAKVASFSIDAREMICLPQAFDLFLKHLVGGLHTVYTKLKRLDITPVVCNVEQVRILRGLGAIQPGVNRCKLVTRDEFDILYNDCTTASRPGRPPKRTLPPPGLSPSGHFLLKKPKIENGCLTNGIDFSGFSPLGLRDGKTVGIPNGYLSPYLLTTHPSMMPTSLAMVTSHSSMHASHRHDEPISLSVNTTAKSDGTSAKSDKSPSSSDLSSPRSGIDRPKEQQCSPPRKEAEKEHERHTDVKSHKDSDNKRNSTDQRDHHHHYHQHSTESEKISSIGNGLNYNQTAAALYNIPENTSSIETLLTNIQGLLKVAADNARQQEKQINLEKAELKMELLREKELREALEKQLVAEQKTRAIIQKRLKKEKKAKRKLQEQLEVEQKTRSQTDSSVIKPNTVEALRVINDAKIASKYSYPSTEALSQELKLERNARTDAERKLLDIRGSLQSFTENFLAKNGHMDYSQYRMECKDPRNISGDEIDDDVIDNDIEDNDDDMADIEDED
uniref:Dachshund homolog 1 isoform X1 n=1 Tax=Saccoglossus kowalevskii TaxID=10224 RepID=A0ABM0MXX5_SACKO|nr:PREDICTED: dachshund homolog 1 isoform X1 [Saccoglossus kowalevskii]